MLTRHRLTVAGLAAHGESPAAFDRRCIPAGGVARPSNTLGILGRRALPAGRIAGLGATRDFHHGLLTLCYQRPAKLFRWGTRLTRVKGTKVSLIHPPG